MVPLSKPKSRAKRTKLEREYRKHVVEYLSFQSDRFENVKVPKVKVQVRKWSPRRAGCTCQDWPADDYGDEELAMGSLATRIWTPTFITKWSVLLYTILIMADRHQLQWDDGFSVLISLRYLYLSHIWYIVLVVVVGNVLRLLYTTTKQYKPPISILKYTRHV